MDLLNPVAQQTAQNQQLTAQQQQQAQELANLLQKQGQNAQKQQFTSPWQVAGQWANALAGKAKQAGINQGYAQMNAQGAPGAPGGNPAAPGTPPAASVPGQSPATPGASPAPQLPWSGAPASSSLFDPTQQPQPAMDTNPSIMTG
jgi:hypothetical protein